VSTIKSSNEHLTLNADGSSKDIKFQANGVEKASIDSSGNLTVSGNLTSVGIDDNADATAMTIDSAENVGIGVTPSAFNASYTGINIGKTGTLLSETAGNDGLYIGSNAYYSTGNNYKYIMDGKACELKMDASASHFKFRTAASGTAGNAITWTDRLEITDDGRGLSQFTAKAWINFNGQISTPSIYDSHNVSSITDNAAAQYTINFSNNMANDDYCAVAHAHAGGGTNDVNVVQMPVSGRAVGSVGCHVMSALNTATTFSNGTDSEVTDILIFGD